MPERVIESNEISLNGVRYPLTGTGRVQAALSSIYPPKVVIGDTSKDSGSGLSVLAITDLRGGMGKYQMGGAEDVNRLWFGYGRRRSGHYVLPSDITQTAATGAATPFTLGAFGELADEVYGAFGTDVRKYNNGTDSWGSSLHTLPAAATDAIQITLGGTTYLVFAHTGGYSYTTDGAAWTDDTADVKYLADWDDRLWGIDNAGQLWFSRTIGTEVNDAQLQLPSGYATDLLVGRDASGNPILYAGTKVGLYAHDIANTRFIPTSLTVPRHDDAGKGCVVWRDDIYFPVGMAIYKYSIGSGGAVISLVGPDREDGVDTFWRGTIAQLASSHNELLVIINSATRCSIMGWDGIGWEIKHTRGGAISFDAMMVSDAYGAYRLWFEFADDAYYRPLDPDIVNPNEVTSLSYTSASPMLVTPWFTAGQSEVDKLLVRLYVEAGDMAAGQTMEIKYSLDYSKTTTSLGTINSDGITTYLFPNSATPTGTVFRAIRFEVDGATNDNGKSPDLLSLTLEYRKKLPAKWGHTFEVEIRDYKGNTAKQLRSNLLIAIENNPLVEFTFRDDDGDTRNFYVDIASATGLEETGADERGISRIVVVER